ncbi:dystrotelin, partial [Canis lupus dingo]|uniref:dystrotelin n=1 Tax=Canis lupus dingo TaxID=286419 RepID=UPI000DC668D9
NASPRKPVPLATQHPFSFLLVDQHTCSALEEQLTFDLDVLHSIENSIYRTAFKLRSVQTLCQLDLMDSSLIQHVLLRHNFWEVRERPLPVQQLLPALQELFQRVGVEKPGQVHPRASELTLSLLTTMYDSTGTGLLKLAPAAAALIALSGDSPLTKYRALFQLYAENNRGGYDSGARMTRSTLRNLLTDLQQIPTVMGESRALCSVESATRSCFQGVLSSTIKEEKFLSWLQSEPPILLWLPTCYRLSATEMITHPVRCRICRNFPITGLRYRCLKCLNFDICQACFFAGLHGRSHQKAHPVTEHCVQTSAKENTKFLVRTLRNNLLQGRGRKKETSRRQWLLDQVTPKDLANHTQASRISIQYSSSEEPVYGSPTRPVETAATVASKKVSPMISRAQQTDNSNPQHQTVVSIRNVPWRTHESINALQKERRFLKKQLSRYKDKLRAIYASQEEKSCRFETKIHKLTANQESLWTQLQQMGQDLQAVLQPLHPSSSSCQNMISKGDHGKGERFRRGGDSSQVLNATEDHSEWEPLAYPTMNDRSHQSLPNAEHGLPNSESLEAVLQLKSTQSTRAQSQAQKTSKEVFSSPPGSQGGLLQDTPQIVPAEINGPALATEMKDMVNIQQGKDEVEGEELQELLSKLTDAFTLEMPPGLQSSVDMDLYCGAERVCRAFSALVDQITVSNLK